MRPLRLQQRSVQTSGAEKPLRTTGCAKAAGPRLALLDQQLEASSSSVATVLPGFHHVASFQQHQQHAPAHEPAPGHTTHGSLDAPGDAGRLLRRLLDSLAGALVGRHSYVDTHVQALLARLFPAATSITATLPSPDCTTLACTTLLHPATAAAAARGGNSSLTSTPPAGSSASAATGGHHTNAARACHQHTERLGRGLCSFQLAAPPSSASLRLMRSLMHQLAARLELEAVHVAASRTACASLALLGRTACAAPAALAALGQPEAMPADCFWSSQ